MESLLARAFDNLSSYDGARIKKGIRHVEGLLASLCLSSNTKAQKSPRKGGRKGVDTGDSNAVEPGSNKRLIELADDPAFREFYKIQDGFQYNIAIHLLDCLDRLVARSQEGQYDQLIISALDLLHGVLLLHPPSKKLFAREQNMNLILDLIEPVNHPVIRTTTLSVLMAVLIGCPENNRCFEGLDGLLAVTSMLDSTPGQAINEKLKEVVYVWLLPESSVASCSSAKKDAALGSEGASRKRATTGNEARISFEDKAKLLSQHVDDVTGFIQQLKRNITLDGVSVNW